MKKLTGDIINNININVLLANQLNFDGVLIAVRGRDEDGDFCIVKDSRIQVPAFYFASVGLPVRAVPIGTNTVAQIPTEVIIISVIFSIFRKVKYIAVINGSSTGNSIDIDWHDNYYSGVQQLHQYLLNNKINSRRINFIIKFSNINIIVADSINYLKNRINERKI